MSNGLTSEDFAKDLLNPFKDKLVYGGIDDEYLIRQLKREFRSKEPKIVKVKGAVDQAGLPRGFKVIATSGLIMELEDAEGKKTLKAGNGETVLQYHVRNIGIAQKARMDAHKLRGDYPAEKHDLSGSFHVTPQFTPEDRELLLKLSNQVVDGILSEHRRTIARD